MHSRLSSYVASYHYSYFKPPHYPKRATVCCPVHCNINSRCKPRLVLLEEHVHIVRSQLSICSFFVMEEKFSCYGPPLQWTFLSRRSSYHTNVYFTRNRAYVTVPITLKNRGHSIHVIVAWFDIKLVGSIVRSFEKNTCISKTCRKSWKISLLANN